MNLDLHYCRRHLCWFDSQTLVVEVNLQEVSDLKELSVGRRYDLTLELDVLRQQITLFLLVDALSSSFTIHKAVKSWLQMTQLTPMFSHSSIRVYHQVWWINVLFRIIRIGSLNRSSELNFNFFDVIITMGIVDLAIHGGELIWVEGIFVKCNIDVRSASLYEEYISEWLLDWEFMVKALFGDRFFNDNTSLSWDRFQSGLGAVHALIHCCFDFVANLKLATFGSVVNKARGHVLRYLESERVAILTYGRCSARKSLNNGLGHEDNIFTTVLALVLVLLWSMIVHAWPFCLLSAWNFKAYVFARKLFVNL